MPPTDLLDMFNQRPAKGSSPARATSRSRDGSQGRGSGGGAETKKRVLGATVMVLLLALAFAAGVGVGRAHHAGGGEPLALVAKPVDHWGLRGVWLPSVGLKADNLKQRVLEELIRRWPELSNHTSVIDAADKTGKPTGQFRVMLQGFESREDAQSVAADLGVWTVEAYFPFRDCRAERMPK